MQGGNSIPALRKNLELHRSPFADCRQIVLKADKGSGTPVSSANLVDFIPRDGEGLLKNA